MKGVHPKFDTFFIFAILCVFVISMVHSGIALFFKELPSFWVLIYAIPIFLIGVVSVTFVYPAMCKFHIK
jgi:hypothetical protein